MFYYLCLELCETYFTLNSNVRGATPIRAASQWSIQCTKASDRFIKLYMFPICRGGHWLGHTTNWDVYTYMYIYLHIYIYIYYIGICEKRNVNRRIEYHLNWKTYTYNENRAVSTQNTNVWTKHAPASTQTRMNKILHERWTLFYLLGIQFGDRKKHIGSDFC